MEVITSYNYPANYPNNLYQLWAVTGPASYEMSIRLEFTDFYLENCCDYVRVYTGASSYFHSSTLRGTYNGYSTPFDIVSSDQYMWIEFTTDGSVRYRGFRAEITSFFSTGNHGNCN